MKYLFTASLIALTVAVYAPQASAGCGQCANDGQPHVHEPGHTHDHSAAECAAA